MTPGSWSPGFDGAVLDQVDNVIRTALMSGVPGLGSEQQVRFQPPDDTWRTAVANLGEPAVNCYLADIRTNDGLRDSEWRVEFGPAGPQRTPPPLRLDCHYLLTAWSPATATPAVEPTLDEHHLLYQAAAVLAQLIPLNPSRVYPPGSPALAAIDPLIRDVDLPVRLAPADGWPKIAEFWGAMGAGDRWKPALWYVVTVPVALTPAVAGPPVTTRIIEYRITGRPETAHYWAQIGGRVTGPAGPLAGATVTLTGVTGAGTATTDADGRWSVELAGPGSYAATVAAAGHPPVSAAVTVPSADGRYDLDVP